MMLSEEQLESLKAAAVSAGVDPAEVVAAAESIESEKQESRPAFANQRDQPKLYKYLLPFLRVSEVRKIFLGIDESVADEGLLCGEFMLKHGGALISTTDDAPEE